MTDMSKKISTSLYNRCTLTFVINLSDTAFGYDNNCVNNPIQDPSQKCSTEINFVCTPVQRSQQTRGHGQRLCKIFFKILLASESYDLNLDINIGCMHCDLESRSWTTIVSNIFLPIG